MDKNELYHHLLTFIEKDNVLLNEPMKNHTSFKIGGEADILIRPTSIDEIKGAILLCQQKNVPYYIIGNGTNLLVKDKGMRYLVIKIAENLSRVDINQGVITAQAGVLLSTLSRKIIENHLKGFEFAGGIPGTLGGAITMNAGAYGREMQDVVKSCKVLTRSGEILDLSLKELEFSYRNSIISKKNYIVLEVRLELSKGNYEEIREVANDLSRRRRTKQPLHLPSAGSTFKRPPGHYASKLIQDAGLKGVRIGGAEVSELHSGFVVNVDNATASDVINLIEHIQESVYDKFGVLLEPEVKIIGED